MTHRPSRRHLYTCHALAPGPAPTPAPARATTPQAGAPTRTQRHGPQPRMPQSQGPTLAQGLGGARHQATSAGPTDVPTADRTRAVNNTASCTPSGPHDPETHSEARATADTGALPTSAASPLRGIPTENAGAGPQKTAEGNSREGPDSRRAEQLAVMSAEAIDKFDRDPMHYDTDEQKNLRRFSNETPGTGRQNMDEDRPRDPQHPIPGAHAGETADTIHGHG